jgi:protein gp37
MSQNSKIEWTDKTWNPIRGCSMAKGSETGGCLNCYAARMAARNLPEMRSPTTGEPFAIMRDSGPRWTGKVELIESKISEPLTWRKPRRIFVNSMSDLFHEDLAFEDILRVHITILSAQQHTFQALTKRPERAQEFYLWWDRTCPGHDYPKNLWLGVSVENQAMANVRIPILLQTPAFVRFVSYEPALGPVNFRRIEYEPGGSGGTVFIDSLTGKAVSVGGSQQLPHLNLVIVGGESGPGARPFDIDWARNTVSQCKSARVAAFVKQLGARPFDSVRSSQLRLTDRKGGKMSEWPDELRVRELPESIS